MKILQKCAPDVVAGAYVDYRPPETERIITRGKLASLHGRIIRLKQKVNRCEVLLTRSVRKVRHRLGLLLDSLTVEENKSFEWGFLSCLFSLYTGHSDGGDYQAGRER